MWTGVFIITTIFFFIRFKYQEIVTVAMMHHMKKKGIELPNDQEYEESIKVAKEIVLKEELRWIRMKEND